MTKTTKYVIGGGAAAAALYLLLRSREQSAPAASVGVTVIKTSDECDPASANYKGAAACQASSDPIVQIGDSLSAAGSAFMDAIKGIFGGSGSANPTDNAQPDFTPSLPPKTDDAGSSFARTTIAGGDGPATRPLQVVYGLGTRLSDAYSGTGATSTRIGH